LKCSASVNRGPEPYAHDGAAWSWLVGWHDCRHVDFSKNKAPDCSGADKVRAVFPKTLFLRMRVRTARMFVSLFAMLLSRSRVVLGIFMLPTRMVMFGLMMMMRCCVVMSSGFARRKRDIGAAVANGDRM
jgi:hypothetical protein